MKTARLVFVAALLAIATAAYGQQVQNHAVPVGRGAGVQGFGAIVPSVAGRPLIDNGAGADPSFGTIANSGFTSGAADTYKGSLNGTNVVDVPRASCTAVNNAIRYTAGVGESCGVISVTTGYDMPINLGLSSSASGGSLTINVTQAAGAAPTSSNPVLVPFRSTTTATGTVTWVSLTSGLSLTIPSGATLGTSNGVPFRVWLFLDYNGGTPEIGVSTCSNTTTIFPCASWETTLRSTSPIGASAPLAGNIYANTGVGLDSVRIVGFCEFANGLVTAGVWTSACTTMQPMGPGVLKPGAVVQTFPITTTTTSGSTTSATYAALTTTPTQTVAMSSAPNLLRIFTTGTMGMSTNANAFIQVQRGSTLIGNPAKCGGGVSGGVSCPTSFMVYDAPGTVSNTTYSFQGKTDAGTLSYPVSNTGHTSEIQEIMG